MSIDEIQQHRMATPFFAGIEVACSVRSLGALSRSICRRHGLSSLLCHKRHPPHSATARTLRDFLTDTLQFTDERAFGRVLQIRVSPQTRMEASSKEQSIIRQLGHPPSAKSNAAIFLPISCMRCATLHSDPSQSVALAALVPADRQAALLGLTSPIHS